MWDFIIGVVEFLTKLFVGAAENDTRAVVQLLVIAGLYVIFLVRSAYKANLDAIDDGPKQHEDGSPKRSALSDRQNRLRLHGFERYQANVRELLNGMAKFVGDAHDEPDDRADTDPADWQEKPVPFWHLSAQSYLFAIGLATLYPLLTLLAMWVLVGRGGVIGPFVVVPDYIGGDQLSSAIFEVVAVVILITLLWYSFPVSRRQRVAHKIFMGLAIVTLLTLLLEPDRPYLALIPAFVGALFAQGPLAAAMAWFSGLAFVAILLYGKTVVPEVAGDIPIAALAAVGFPIAALGGYYAVHRFDGDVRRYLLVATMFVLSLIAAYYFSHELAKTNGAKPFIELGLTLPGAVAMLCILPLANAPFDWLSFSITRRFMELIADPKGRLAHWGGALVFLVLDIGVALVLSVGVTYCALFALDWFFAAAKLADGIGVPMTAEGVVEGLRTDPWSPANIWVYAMLYSTLIPTIAHIIVGVYAIAQSVPLVDFNRLAARLGTDWHHTDRRRSMARQLTFVQVAQDLIAAVLFWILVAAFLYALPWVSNGILDIIEGLRRLSS